MKKRVEFQLERESVQDARLLDIVTFLKKKHRFVPTLREAIQLIMDLRNGSTDVLFEMFPWIKEQVQVEQNNVVTVPPEPTDNSELVKDIKTAIQQGIKQAMLELPANIPDTSDDYPTMKAGLKPMQPTTGKILSQQQFAMPTFDDDDEPDLHVAASKNQDSAFNFVSALKNMQ